MGVRIKPPHSEETPRKKAGVPLLQRVSIIDFLLLRRRASFWQDVFVGCTPL